jgi:hypothetical protein
MIFDARARGEVAACASSAWRQSGCRAVTSAHRPAPATIAFASIAQVRADSGACRRPHIGLCIRFVKPFPTRLPDLSSANALQPPPRRNTRPRTALQPRRQCWLASIAMERPRRPAGCNSWRVNAAETAQVTAASPFCWCLLVSGACGSSA